MNWFYWLVIVVIAILVIRYFYKKSQKRQSGPSQTRTRSGARTSGPRTVSRAPTGGSVRKQSLSWRCSPRELFAQEHISYSRLNLFEQCPRHFELVHLVGLDDPVGKPAELGSVVHQMLNLYVRENIGAPGTGRIDVGALDHVLGYYKRAVADIKPHHSISRTEVAPFCRNFLALNAGCMDVFAAEHRCEALVGSTKLKCIVDRIDRAEKGALVIVDYKTGNPQYAADRQLNVYGYALASVQPNSIALQFHFLKPGQVKSWTFTQSIRDTTETWLRTSVSKIESTRTFRQKRGPLCQYCGVSRYCD